MKSSHMAFKPLPETYAFASKIESMDLMGDTLCYGDNKGVVTFGQLKITDKGIEIETMYKSESLKKKITKVEVLKRTKHVAVICNNQLYILDPMNLQAGSSYLKDVNTITGNTAGCIAANTGKHIYFYAFKAEENTFKRSVIGKRSDIVVEDNILKLSNALYTHSME